MVIRTRNLKDVCKLGLTLLSLATILLASGCFTRTIYVKEGTPVRLRQTVKKAKVWVYDKDGRPVSSTMDLAEGLWVVADDGE